jgi:NADPH2:quinone reductase
VLASGSVNIAPPTRYDLADAAQAHADLEARKTTGGLVLVP